MACLTPFFMHRIRSCPGVQLCLQDDGNTIWISISWLHLLIEGAYEIYADNDFNSFENGNKQFSL